jgi:hypothetical protein
MTAVAVMAAAALLLATTPAGRADACEPRPGAADAQRVEGAHYVLAWRTPAPIRQGEFFFLDVAICAKSGGAAPSTLRVDARMPAHQHGMNYRPTVAAAGDGRFAARGLMFHMPGAWEIAFDVNPGGVPRETLRSAVALP